MAAASQSDATVTKLKLPERIETMAPTDDIKVSRNLLTCIIAFTSSDYFQATKWRAHSACCGIIFTEWAQQVQIK